MSCCGVIPSPSFLACRALLEDYREYPTAQKGDGLEEATRSGRFSVLRGEELEERVTSRRANEGETESDFPILKPHAATRLS